MTVDPTKVIQLLCAHEEAIGNLYAEYARVFPEQQAFWTSFSKEEYMHADWIRSLQEMMIQGECLFTGRFNEAAIQTSLTYVASQTERAKKGNVSLKEALSIALSIEDSLLEKKFFSVFSCDSVKAEQKRQMLIDATHKHRSTMQKAWEENRVI